MLVVLVAIRILYFFSQAEMIPVVLDVITAVATGVVGMADDAD
jgi:hypothetical protein